MLLEMSTQAIPLRSQHPGLSGSSRLASALTWLSLGWLLGAAAIGLGWDRRWHATHVFNTFYSPPHLFIYAMLALAVGTLGLVIWMPRLRSAFGPAVRVGAIPLSLPLPLAFCAGGLAVVMLAGLLDDVWHSSFGLDETAWSFPHAMIGAGLQLTFMGILSARLALKGRERMTWYSVLGMALLLFLFSADRFVGPLNQASAAFMQAVSRLPVLALQPTYQHVARISLRWDLFRDNLLFAPLAALATGMALSLVWSFAQRRWILLVVAVLTTLLVARQDLGTSVYFGIARDFRNWLPVPVLPAAATFAALSLTRLPERWSWTAAGAVFGLLCLAWNPTVVAVPAAAVAMVVGAAAGRAVWHAIESPAPRTVLAVVSLLGVGVPAITGVVDLYLRLNTP